MCNMVCVTCARCSVNFDIPKKMHTDRRRDHKSFYCPNGHNNYYPGKSDLEVLQNRVEYLERQNTSLRIDLGHRGQEIERLRRSNASLRGIITRARRDRTYLRPEESEEVETR